MIDNKAIVTGAAGFLGTALVEELLTAGYHVYAVVKPGSIHNERLRDFSGVDMIELDIADIDVLPQRINTEIYGATFFHIAWGYGGRYDYVAQTKNIDYTINAVKAAGMLKCTRFIATGSQAEYGATVAVQKESMMPNPFCDYGAAKVAACILSKRVAEEVGLEWLWGRVFSLYGKHESSDRMIRAVSEKLQNNEKVELSSCRQNWDYLNVYDGAKALIALAERGHNGEIYNIANGKYKPLKQYIEAVRNYYRSSSKITYGKDPDPFVSLQPDVSRIKEHTGWEPGVSFEDGLAEYGDLKKKN